MIKSIIVNKMPHYSFNFLYSLRFLVVDTSKGDIILNLKKNVYLNKDKQFNKIFYNKRVETCPIVKKYIYNKIIRTNTENMEVIQNVYMCDYPY
jgi:hypothetical protein